MKDMQYSNFQLMLTYYPRRGVTYIYIYYCIIVLARKLLARLGKGAGKQS